MQQYSSTTGNPGYTTIKMKKNNIVAEIKIKEQNGSYYDVLDSFKNIPIKELIQLLNLKYGDNDNFVNKIDKLVEQSTIFADKPKTYVTKEETPQ